MHKVALVGLIVWLALAPHAQADESASDMLARTLVDTFKTMCVENVPDLDRIEDAANALGLKNTTGSDPLVPAASSSQTRFRTWRVVGADGTPLSLSITGGQVNNKKVSACAVASAGADAQAAEQMLKVALQLGRPFRTDTDQGQKYLDWNKTKDGRRIIISAVDATPEGRSGVSLAATVIGK